MTHEDFERKLMNMLLCGEDSVLKKLRKQYTMSEITSREFTGVGFYTNFFVNTNDFHVDKKSFQIVDVDGTIDGIEGAIGFVLFIKDGLISFLEGYTNTIMKWPDSYDDVILVYNTGHHRDIEALRSHWI